MTTARRRRTWTDQFIDENTTSGALDEDQLISEAQLVEISKGATLVRMIGNLTVIPTATVNDSTDVMIYSMGIGLVSTDVISGSIDVSSEADTPMSGWLWRVRELVFEANTDVLRINFDIRAQRKLMYGEPRIFMANDLFAGTSFTVSVSGIIRSLYLLA